MKRRPRYTDEALGQLEVVADFLPSPDQLVPKEDGIKVTISLSKRSVAFFKQHAARRNVPYQKMIRNLLDTLRDALFAAACAGPTAQSGDRPPLPSHSADRAADGPISYPVATRTSTQRQEAQ